LLAVRELDPRPGETVLDLCAAPGGKTTFIAQLMKNQCRIVAHDNDPARVKLIEENCARLGVTNVEVTSGSYLLLAPSSFDKVLVDAPCSNTGVLRRRVDLRWRITPGEIARLCRTQLDLLKQASRAVRPGGVLVYSTCSLELEENSEVVKNFLAEVSGFALERERMLTPCADGVDGAFVARLRRA
jgi:16S rRNA (cytosine967-C5)-methyltransferase